MTQQRLDGLDRMREGLCERVNGPKDEATYPNHRQSPRLRLATVYLIGDLIRPHLAFTSASRFRMLNCEGIFAHPSEVLRLQNLSEHAVYAACILDQSSPRVHGFSCFDMM